MSSRTRPRRRARRATTLRERASVFLPLRSWRFQIVGVFVGVIVAILSAQSFASAREAAASYLIQPGDTLSAIATTTGVSVDKLISLNAIKNPDLIIAGDTLSLAGAASAATAAVAADGQYTIKSGDTLWSVARSTGTSVDAIVQVNGLTNADKLAVGQVLRLPTSAGPVQHSANVVPQKPKPTMSPLQQKVASEAQRVAGQNVHVGVSAVNLATGEKLALHADDEFPSASTMKLPILVELERQIAAGNLSWTESLRAEASAMIAVSDNTAANQIADAVHPQSVNDTMTRLGLSGTHFMNPFNDARNASNPGANRTTPANMVNLLQLIATDQIVSPQVSGDIRSLLARNTDRSKLARLLPGDARLAHKSGWYDGVANDVGIVTVDRAQARWVIAVYSENVPDAETGNQLVAAISRAVYDAWAPS